MKSLVYTLCIVAVSLAILGSRSPLSARQASLDERVRTLEIQVANLNQRVSVLEGGRGGGTGGGSWNDGIKRTYTGIGETWTLKTITTRNNIITLANGTRWEVSPADTTIFSGWKVGEIILIGTNNDKQFPYSLTNQAKKQRVTVSYVGSY